MLTRPLTRPLVRPLTRRVTEPAFGSLAAQIRLLFSSGEQGAWYDPSDLSTLFQDSAGTTPVTALGQPVGLMLDKSKGLVIGTEEIENGAFDSEALWALAGGATIGSGALTLAAISASRATQILTLAVGKWYRWSFDVVSNPSGTNVRLDDDGGASVQVLKQTTATGTFSGFFYSTTETIRLINTNGIGAAVADNISVRELPGNHARQLTDTARPTLQAGNKIDFDGVDDKLTTTFPDLGTAVTIVRSVPGTGASILTGQTIGAGARDDSTDHHGLLIINRALTAPETALVTRWANMRAGV